ncbi:T9SS type A sorting domain-containing protein [bacterium SCSIO 12741]|nr:T9SS type A sorting domain-containing protein [bacterium SCSIO 12741]
MIKSKAKRSEFLLGFSGTSSIHANSGGTICMGDSILLKHPTTGLSYSWLRNGANIAGSSHELQAKVPGTYQVISTINNCSDTSAPFALTVNNLPSVSFSPLNAVCAHILFDTLNGGMPAGGTYKHQFVSGNLFVVQNAGPGDHRIVYEYTDGNGCKDTSSQVLKVHALPTINLSLISPLCEDSAGFTLSNGSPMGGSYSVNGSASTQFDASALGAGTHTVKYEYTDSNQCPNSDSIDVVVNALPMVRLNLINDKYCEYDAAKLMDGQNPRGGSFSGAGVVGNTWEPQNSGPGNHVVTYFYTDPSTGCSNQAVDTMYIYPRPTKPTASQAADSVVSTPGNAYQWYNLQRKINGATDRSYHPKIDDRYFVIITSAEGCTSLPSDTVDFKKPNSVTEYANASGMRVYPNPADQQVYLDFEGKVLPQGLELLDMQGKRISIQTVSSTSTSISLGDLEPGVYLIRAWFEDQMVPVRIQKR